MTITYKIDKSLYLNITNRCSNQCDFCIRNYSDGVGDADNLWLEKEPSFDEIISDLKKHNLTEFEEVVFCGYGEPLYRLEDLINIAKFIKQTSKIKIRINTNGQGNLINNKDVTPLFEKLIDVISISLNAKNAKQYQKICNSIYGDESFIELINFAKLCKKYIKKVVLTVVSTLPLEDINECEEIAKNAGVDFKVRTIY